MLEEVCFNLSDSPYVLRDKLQEIRRTKRKFYCIFDRITTVFAVMATSGLQMPEESFLVLYEKCKAVETEKFH